MIEQYYIKKNGKYVPVHDPYALEGLYNGAWLVIVKKGGVSVRQALNPKFAELDAALEYLEEELVKGMHEASKMHPASTLMSKKEQKAWAAYKKIMGGKIPTMFCYSSHHDIARGGCNHIKKIMIEHKMSLDKIKEKYTAKERKITNAIEDLEV